MKEPHEPTSCELWELWKEVISRMTTGKCLKPHPYPVNAPPTLDDETKKVANQAQADARWIIQNTKPCPHCK